MTTADRVAIFKTTLRAAWQDVMRRNPDDVIYAFGVWTTTALEGFEPFVCSDAGLEEASKRYVKKKHVKTVAEARKQLRWSITESPFFDPPLKKEMPLDDAFADLPNHYDIDEPKAVARDGRMRLRVAVTALKQLEAEGLFGRGSDRERLVLLIEAGDREQEWADKWAKQLNPKKIYDAYQASSLTDDEPTPLLEYGVKRKNDSYALAVDETEETIVVGSAGQMTVFSVSPPRQRATFRLPKARPQYVHVVGISRDGSTLAAMTSDIGRIDGCRRLFFLYGKDWSEQIDIDLGGAALSMAFAPDGTHAIIGVLPNRVERIDARTGARTVLYTHRHRPTAVVLSRDGKLLASASAVDGIQIRRTRDNTLLHTINEPADFLAFDPSGRRLAASLCYRSDRNRSAGRRRQAFVAIYDTRSGVRVDQVFVPGMVTKQMAFAPGGKRLVVAVHLDDDDDYSACIGAVIVDLKSKREVARLRGLFSAIESFAWLNDGRQVALALTNSERRPLVLWEMSELM